MPWTYLGNGEIDRQLAEYEEALRTRSVNAVNEHDAQRVLNDIDDWESFNEAILELESFGRDPRVFMKRVPNDDGADDAYIFSKYQLNVIYLRDPTNKTARPLAESETEEGPMCAMPDSTLATEKQDSPGLLYSMFRPLDRLFCHKSRADKRTITIMRPAILW
jgi:hypothetical protein